MKKGALLLAATVLAIGIALALFASTEGGSQLLRAQLQRVVDKVDSVVGRRLDRTTAALAEREALRAADGDGLVFLHHSCGRDWLNSGLLIRLLARPYLETVRSITYGTEVAPDAGRPDSLRGEHPPGHYTDMRHWLPWFNDYLGGVLRFGRSQGQHRIVVFKSCFPNSNILTDEGSPDPFAERKSAANYQAVFRHPDSPVGLYRRAGVDYRPLEAVFAAHPETLFVMVTAPPRHYGPPDASTDDEAARARAFNRWLEHEWLPAYGAAHPGLDNVAVYNWFEKLAYPPEHPHHPGRLLFRYGGLKDSHPNRRADRETAEDFVQWLDGVWAEFAQAR